MTNDRLYSIRRVLWEHSHPTLRNMDADRIGKLAAEILRIADGDNSPWTKWGKEREQIAKRAAEVWVPDEDLRNTLNHLPGPELTNTDVAQRLYALRWDEGCSAPDEAIKEECLVAYAQEKATGTEFIAILGWLEEWMIGANERLMRRRQRENEDRIAREKEMAEKRLRSGADCPWTQAVGVADLHCRRNGRLYRLRALDGKGPLEPKVEVFRVHYLEEKRGASIGRYRTRGDATKAINEIAYKDEWE